MTRRAAAVASLGIAVAVAMVATGYDDLAALVASVALLACIVERRGIPELAAVTLCAWIAAAGPDLGRYATTSWVRTWNLFHYGLGADYFAELGYTDLYAAALHADAQDARRFAGVTKIRDLRTYAIERRDDAYQPTPFTRERWTTFRADVAALGALEPESAWKQIFRDRGYNPSPAHAAVTGPIVRALPLRDPVGRKVLGLFDPLAYLLAFGALGWAFGPRAGLVAAASFALAVVNRDRLVGGFLQYDWFVAVGIAFAGLRGGRPGLAGASLGWAAVTRVFPAALAAVALVPGIARAVRRRRLPDAATGWFAAGLLAAIVAGIGIGASTPAGPAAWTAFADKIVHHAEAHAAGEQRIGLAHALTVSWPLAEDEDDREALLADREGLRRTLTAVGLALVGLAAIRRRPDEALLLGMAVVYLGTVASRYYFALLVLVPPAAFGRRGYALDVASAALVAAGLGLAAADLGPYPTYLTYEWLVGLFLAGWVGERLMNDALVVQRAARRRIRRGSSSPAARGSDA